MTMDVMDHVAHQRWLINNGFINDLHKDNLYAYGAIVHKDIKAVYTKIDVTTKKIYYSLYVDSILLRQINKFNKLSNDKTLIGLWLFKRFLQKRGNLNFHMLLNNFIKDYCGTNWNVEVSVEHVNNYIDGFKHLQKNEKRDIKTSESNKSTS